MSFVRRQPARFVLALGLVLAVQSIAWEYVRMKPDYRFIVTPWSIRGYELTQGRIVAIMAAGLLVIAVLAWLRLDERFKPIGAAVAAGTFLGAMALAAIVNPEQSEISLNELGGFGAAAAVASVVMILYRELVAERLGGFGRYLTWPIWIVVLIVAVLIITPLAVDDSVNLPLWAIAAIALAVLFIPALVVPPRELAVNRILILSVAGAWLVQILSSGAIRSTLLRHQAEIGVPAQYKDTQITSGMMLAFFGFMLAMAGAVALWAQRRDQTIARQRARQQREAAQESIDELAPAS